MWTLKAVENGMKKNPCLSCMERVLYGFCTHNGKCRKLDDEDMYAIVTIKIPKEFVGELEKDRFLETFQRVKADFHCMAGNYEEETINMLIEAFKNAEIKDEEEVEK